MPQQSAVPVVEQPTLRRSLGLFDGIAILIGITIGSGIFAAPGVIASHHETFTAIALFWLLGGAYAFMGALIYAELGTRMPNTGGEYIYLSRCFGPLLGFMFGWSQLFMIRTSAAAGLALVVVDYCQRLFGAAPFNTLTRISAAIAVIVLLGLVNYRGIHWGALYQKFSTVIKIGGLLALVAVGALLLLTTDRPNLLWTSAPATAVDLGFFGIGNAALAMMLIVFSYSGWDRVGYVAGEMKNPQRIIPLSMFVGMAIVMVCYVLANLIYHAVLGMAGVRETSTVAWDTAQTLLGPAGAIAVALIVIISATGSINGTMMTAPRVYYAMARDGLFLRWFNHVHPVFRTPSRALLAHVVWASVIVAVRVEFTDIVSGMAFAVLIFYALSTFALFRMRRDAVGESRVDEATVDTASRLYKVPLYPWLPLLYLLGIGLLLAVRAYFDPRNTLIDLLFICSGVPFALYFCRGMSRESLPVPVEAPLGELDRTE